MRQRLLAIAGALVLVVVAVAVRGVLADGSGSGGGSSPKGKPVVACTPDLMAVCDALAADGKIAADPPALDLDGAAKPAANVDGWITWDPAPGIAAIDAGQAGDAKPWQVGRALGSSALAVAFRQGSSPSFPSTCTQVSFGWSCLNAAAGTGQGVGVGTGKTAESLARIYPVALALVPQDGDFTDLTTGQLATLITSPAVGQRAFRAQLNTLQTAPGALGFLVGPAGAFAAADKVTTIAPKGGGASVVVAYAPRTGASASLGDDAFASDGVLAALREAGVEPGTGKLAGDERAGDLYAVRQKVG